MKKLKFAALTTMVLLAALIIASCAKKSDKSTEKATVVLMLTDAPALYDAVNIDIQEVLLQSDSGDWISVPLVNPGVYNLRDFSNGLDTLLGTVEMPAGTLSQLRLVLGGNSTIVVDGISHPLVIPSGSTSGLKFNVHASLDAGFTYKFWIDFDAARSIVVTGNGKYLLKPVIRMFGESTSGAIKGSVFPAAAKPLVKVFNTTDTLMAIPAADGNFLVKGMPAGTYTVTFSSGIDTSGYLPQSLVGVVVTKGITTQLQPDTLVKGK